ncbi:hypothetical protein CE91St46_18200 [Eubacteriales bacterium]|nr:hypothetical protein CE91St46_18200 [Eubacteriales bacterium]GKH63431.1 hypothetical protein CE91St47_19000 [Eubacteriales bacterium]
MASLIFSMHKGRLGVSQATKYGLAGVEFSFLRKNIESRTFLLSAA